MGCKEEVVVEDDGRFTLAVAVTSAVAAAATAMTPVRKDDSLICLFL